MKDERGFYSREEAERINDQLTENFVNNFCRGVIAHGADCVPGMLSETVWRLYQDPVRIKIDEISRVAKGFGIPVKELFDKQTK